MMYHLLCLILGGIVIALCYLLIPISFLIFLFLGHYFMLLSVAYICGRIVMGYAIPRKRS